MKKVLIIEDDFMIADMLEEVLVNNGFEVCGIARTPTEALTLAEQHQPNLAIVDVYLIDGLGTMVAPELIRLYRTGILYTTANVDAVLQADGHAYMEKPFRLQDAAKALHIVDTLINGGSTVASINGLHLLVR